MIFYIIPYLFVLIFCFFIYKNDSYKKISFSVVFILLLPALLVALFRGNVGTDTINYLTNYEMKYSQIQGVNEFEPGFEILSDIFVQLGFTSKMFVNAIALLSTLFLSISFSGKKERTLLLLLVLFPLFFFDFTMNGLRYGLSFSIASIAIDVYYKKRMVLFSVLAIIAISIQYSSFLIILVFLMDRLKFKQIVFLISVFTLIIILFWSYFEMIYLYLTLKQDAYKDSQSPGITSGLAPLLLFLILSTAFSKYSLKEFELKGLYILIFFELISFVIAKFTYAGLRFQTLFLFALIVYIKNNLSAILNYKKFMTVNLIVSFISILVFFKNIILIVEDDQSPFLPYKFFWE